MSRITATSRQRSVSLPGMSGTPTEGVGGDPYAPENAGTAGEGARSPE